MKEQTKTRYELRFRYDAYKDTSFFSMPDIETEWIGYDNCLHCESYDTLEKANKMYRFLMSKIGSKKSPYNQLDKHFPIKGELKCVLGVYKITEEKVTWFEPSQDKVIYLEA